MRIDLCLNHSNFDNATPAFCQLILIMWTACHSNMLMRCQMYLIRRYCHSSTQYLPKYFFKAIGKNFKIEKMQG